MEIELKEKLSKRPQNQNFGARAGRDYGLKVAAEHRAAYALSPKHCTECGSELPYEQRDCKFCSRSCAASFNNKERNRPKRDAICLHCGTVFPANRKSYGKFCSLKCQGQYKWENETKSRIMEGQVSNRSTLKKFLIERDGHQCSCCGNTEWIGKPISIEVDHIDGNPANDMPKNLRLLCPNCHSMTETYKGKNKGHGRGSRGISRS